MPGIEELLREELKRVTGQVQPGQLRPLRPPVPGAGRRRWLLPVSVAAAVTAIATVAALLAGPPARPLPYAAPAPASAAMPRYYVTVARTSAGLEAVVRDSAHGSVTGSVPLPETQGAIGQSVAAANERRTFVIAVNVIDASTIAGTVAIRYFRMSVSAGGRPGTPVELPPGLGNAEPLTGMALSPDGTVLALSLEHFEFTADMESYGDVMVVNLATGQTRTWTGRSEPGFWPGAARWEDDGRTLTFTWWHTTSLTTGARAMVGVRQLDTSAPGSNLLASRLNSFPAATPDYQSALVMPGDRDIIASSCRDVAASGGYHGTARAQIVELSAANGQLIRVLRTQVIRFPNANEEHEALDATCAVLSADPSGNHLLVQAFSLGRIDNGVFTALPGASSSGVPFAAAAW